MSGVPSWQIRQQTEPGLRLSGVILRRYKGEEIFGVLIVAASPNTAVVALFCWNSMGQWDPLSSYYRGIIAGYTFVAGRRCSLVQMKLTGCFVTEIKSQTSIIDQIDVFILDVITEMFWFLPLRINRVRKSWFITMKQAVRMLILNIYILFIVMK